MIYGYIRTSRAAVDGLAGMHPETQVRALADAGVEPAHIISDVGISGSVPAGERPGWAGLDARLLRGDTLTVAALDRISRNRVELVAVSWSPCTGAGWAWANMASLHPGNTLPEAIGPMARLPLHGLLDNGGWGSRQIIFVNVDALDGLAVGGSVDHLIFGLLDFLKFQD